MDSLDIKAVILESYDAELLKALRASGLQVGVLQEANGEEPWRSGAEAGMIST